MQIQKTLDRLESLGPRIENFNQGGSNLLICGHSKHRLTILFMQLLAKAAKEIYGGVLGLELIF